MTDIKAGVVAHSVSPEGIEIKTLQLRYPKFIHGELMTHRVFSRNASSSRAVPTAKLLEEARRDDLRAEPSFSVINAPGMQGGRSTTGGERLALQVAWRNAALSAAETAQEMFEMGGAKQDVNRLLEPFTHINVLVTATEWDNFFGLRLDKDAQPEMRKLAEAMWRAIGESEPQTLKSGEWHLPYVTQADRDLAARMLHTLAGLGNDLIKSVDDVLLRVSVARCARVSYLSFDTGRRSTIEEDVKLYDRLFNREGAKHASPAEHQATPDQFTATSVVLRSATHEKFNGFWHHPSEHGNFVGWRQYRKTIPGEAVAPLPKEYAK